MDQLVLKRCLGRMFRESPDLCNELLHLFRVRAADETACAIKHLSIPKSSVKRKQLQDELELFVCSLDLVN